MKKTNKTIAVQFCGYQLTLTDCHEVFGHDDSLPFNANWTLTKGDEIILSGEAWNDGWGGIGADYSTDQPWEEAKPIIDGVNQMLVCFNYKPKGYNFIISHNFSMLIDCMACLAIDGVKPKKVYSQRQFLNYLKS